MTQTTPPPTTSREWAWRIQMEITTRHLRTEELPVLAEALRTLVGQGAAIDDRDSDTVREVLVEVIAALARGQDSTPAALAQALRSASSRLSPVSGADPSLDHLH